ncbi:type I phosphomannose isomerase catalytic subunit [Flavobacterium silvaticum]|uniref:Phosphohexomutase n=1 Tax=Flavobacterium silvaticum TaxID=1852020 RepID=A0A972FPG2_9FLAO|nr:type I phosphomannose isomerase catalytic subunit [Flavobacterium silvaticum]NMH29448.1 class I mannose-6-phosphate isomerase [Flavobacterium silvaticum]
MSFKSYPFQFQPILKERIWGGTKLKSELNKPITSNITGESWELSTVKGDVSVIANGDYEGKSLQEIIENYPAELLGERVYKKFGAEFPLLFKFLDAREDLSIQVHPNDELAQKRHHSFGKTEMWYVMQADAGSRIIAGFKHDSNREEFLSHVHNNTIVDILGAVPAKAGDVYFLETGTVHAIGAGVLIAEIQQTSDITYRIYDFDRVDANGNKRELHLDLSLDAINYKASTALQSHTDETNKVNTLVDCPYFTTNLIPLDGEYKSDIPGGTFSVYMLAKGNATMTVNGSEYQYNQGDTILIPADLKGVSFSGKADLLEIYIS